MKKTKAIEEVKKSEKKAKFEALTQSNFKSLYEYVIKVLKRLKEKFTYFNMNGTENLWLLKPGCSSRGRGIKIYKTYDKVLGRID